jgi:hypothetical protein
LRQRCLDADVDVALQVDPPALFARNYRSSGEEKLVEGPAALAAFLFVVTEELRATAHWSSHMYRRYIEQVAPPQPLGD